MPNKGDRIIATEVLIKPAATIAPVPALATPAPTKPPTKACDDDDGIPNHQVIRFQEIKRTIILIETMFTSNLFEGN